MCWRVAGTELRYSRPMATTAVKRSKVKRWLRRLGLGLGGLVVLWIGGLLVVGLLARGYVERRAVQRLRASLGAEVSLGRVQLGLVRGRLGFDRLHVERRDRGYLRIDVAHAETRVLPLGLVLLQDDLGSLRSRGVDVEVSALGALDLRGGKRAPLSFARLQLDDARFTVEGTSVLPSLAHVTMTIEHVVVGRTTLRTPLSWVFGLRTLKAHLALSTGASAELEYRGDGKLRLTSAAFGPAPVEIPFVIPPLDPEHEPEQLAALGRTLAAELTRHAGKAWLVEKAKQRLLDRLMP